MGESLTVDTGRERIAGTFLDLDAGGALVMRDALGLQRKLTFGDVTLARRTRGRASDGGRSASRPLAGELVFMALGGIGEIGMNCYLYGLGPADARQWLMIDLGITFPRARTTPGIDVILPDLRFIEEERPTLAGLVLTHAHEDHLGARHRAVAAAARCRSMQLRSPRRC